MRKIFIGVGHGGTDSGAVANGLKEKDLNLVIALACRDVLERHGVTVLLSRTKDEGDTVNEEIKECNAFKPDFAIDIHNNSEPKGTADGAEVFHNINNAAGKNLAENVNKQIIAIGQNSRGVKTKENSSGAPYYSFIRHTHAPAIIVECAFISNKTDIAIIDTPAEQQEMGVAIAKGILATLGITYKEKAVTGATDNVPDAYASDAIIWAIKNGILYGDSNGNYKLHTNVSRQDMLVFLYRAMSK